MDESKLLQTPNVVSICSCKRETYRVYYGSVWTEFCPACNMAATSCDCEEEK